MRNQININLISSEDITPTLIYRTTGLETNDRIKLIQKASPRAYFLALTATAIVMILGFAYWLREVLR